MEDFNNETELKDFMARIERENLEAYVQRLKDLFKDGNYEYDSLEELKQSEKKYTRLLAELEKEYKENPKPYEFNLDLENLNEAIQHQREWYIQRFKGRISYLQELISEYVTELPGKVFVVTSGFYEDYSIDGVYTNQEAARLYVRSKGCPEDMQIEIYDLNPPLEKEGITI